MSSKPGPRRHKKPIADRFFVISLLAAQVLIVSHSEVSAETIALSESEAVERAHGVETLNRQYRAGVDAVRADAIEHRRWSNPTVQWTREQPLGAPDTFGEDQLEVHLRLPLSGRHRQTVRAIDIEVDAKRMEAIEQLRQRDQRVRYAFYDLLEAQQQLEVFEAHLDETDELLEWMNLLFESGEASQYELKRLQSEQNAIASEQHQIRARREQRSALLGGLITSPGDELPRVRAEGPLAPASYEHTQSVSESPQLMALQKRQHAAEERSRALRRWWFPDPMLQAGIIRDFTGDSGRYGATIGLAFEIPFVDENRGPRQRQKAEIVKFENQRLLKAHELDARLYGLHAQLEAMVEATADYRDEIIPGARDVLRLTRRAYEGGEASVAEVLDALRTVKRAELRHIELAAKTRAIEVELRGHQEGAEPWREHSLDSTRGE